MEDKMAIQALGEVNARAEINAAKEVAASPSSYAGAGCCHVLRAKALQRERLMDRCRGEILPRIHVCTEPRWVTVNRLETAPT